MRRAVIFFFVLMLALRGFAAEAFHYITPALLQIPPVGQNPGTIQDPQWGGLRYVLFDSDADLLSNDSTGRQIFVFDLQQRDVDTSSLALTQVTAAPLDDNRRPATGHHAITIAYDAQIGGVGPRQLMLINRSTGIRTQLTNGASDSTNASFDDGERVVVFESAADFFAKGVGGTQIYRIDLRKVQLGCPFPCVINGTINNAGLSQITTKVGTNRNAVTSTGGKWIVFESDADLLNSGQTENQIYLYNSKTWLTLRVSPGPGAARNPTITRDGGRIVFESDADGTGSTQLFLYHRAKKTLQQIPTPPGGTCTNPSISSNGHAVAFLSSNDLLSRGSDGPELYSYDLKKNVLVQLTNAPASVSSPAYSSGVFTVFLADGDLAGNGSPGTQLYLVNLFALANQAVP